MNSINSGSSSPNMAPLYSQCPKRCESAMNTLRNRRENKKKIYRERRDSKEQQQRACNGRASGLFP
ncbi:hypothetical protein ACQCVM_07455 [Rossellomorea aquimaris]